MKIVKAKNALDVGRKAAGVIFSQVVLKPNSVLGLATGSTPIETYRQLIEWYKKGDIDFSEVTSINLDEYCGLSSNHPQSYRFFMQENLFDHINISPKKTFVPNGLAGNVDRECRAYDKLIRDSGGIDLQLLGIGHDGHIGFNEPADYFALGTHKVELLDETIDANARFFETRDEVPRQAVTMGIRDIMQAKKILLIAQGEEKADILKKALKGKVTPFVPASVLQLHPDIVVVGDEAALKYF